MTHRFQHHAILVGALCAAACSDSPAGPNGGPLSGDTLGGISAPVRTWLSERGRPFDGVELEDDLADLAFVGDLVGNARVVSLGENTHGTREFFQTKARLVRYLVEEKGFTSFAIEASWAEADRLDRYVRTGEGDPRTLLAGLYFWTWNTEAVLELIEWMRTWNAAGGDVGFHGFDMQHPGMPLALVERFYSDHDPDRLDWATERLACLQTWANNPRGTFPNGYYDDTAPAERQGCTASLGEVLADLEEREADLVTAAGEPDYARAHQAVVVALQYERLISEGRSRDQSMADNVVWLHDRLGPGGKMVLWAHNFHVASLSTAMGGYLRGEYGSAMVIFGFTHTAGRFTAVRVSGGSSSGRGTETLDPALPGSVEATLSEGPGPRFMLDIRHLDAGDPGSGWLTRPVLTRAIGCCYDPNAYDAYYWATAVMPSLYDVLIHFQDTGPTRVLPYIPPETFFPQEG